jgi:hypothetical protein
MRALSLDRHPKMTMWRSLGKLRREREKVDLVSLFKSCLTHTMLLRMMLLAQANGPLVGRLQRLPAIRSAADVCAFDGELLASRHRAVMPSHPGSMGGKGARLERSPRPPPHFG